VQIKRYPNAPPARILFSFTTAGKPKLLEPGFWKGNGKLTQVMPEQGKFEAKRLELIDPEQIAPAFR
jgi:hypothetical protein